MDNDRTTTVWNDTTVRLLFVTSTSTATCSRFWSPPTNVCSLVRVNSTLIPLQTDRIVLCFSFFRNSKRYERELHWSELLEDHLSRSCELVKLIRLESTRVLIAETEIWEDLRGDKALEPAALSGAWNVNSELIRCTRYAASFFSCGLISADTRVYVVVSDKEIGARRTNVRFAGATIYARSP